MYKIAKVNEEINKLFDIFNKKYFNNSLERPIVTVQTNTGNKMSKGWYTVEKIWKDHEENKNLYEISISAEFLYKGTEDICATLIHEMVHLYCKQNNIKDVSRGNTYHNKKFKEEAEKRGLIITYNKKIGWSLTELTEETKAYVKSLKTEISILTRLKHNEKESTQEEDGEETGEEEKEEKKSSTRKYVCPKCKTIVRATKEVNIICGECKCKFIQEEKK